MALDRWWFNNVILWENVLTNHEQINHILLHHHVFFNTNHFVFYNMVDCHYVGEEPWVGGSSPRQNLQPSDFHRPPPSLFTIYSFHTSVTKNLTFNLNSKEIVSFVRATSFAHDARNYAVSSTAQEIIQIGFLSLPSFNWELLMNRLRGVCEGFFSNNC